MNKIDPLDINSVLREIPLFAGLGKRERDFVRQRSAVRDYKKGEIIYREGSAADAFYCIILGRVMIYTQDFSGRQSILEYLHRGKYFGIISLLTGETHSVTAQALNDCVLLVIPKDDFGVVLNKVPRLAIGLSQTLSRRLKSKDIHQKTIFESTIVSVFSSYSQAGKTVYALNLALSMRKETGKSIVILDILPQEKTHSLPRRLKIENCPVLDISAEAGANKVVRDFLVKSSFSVDIVCIYYDPQDDTFLRRILDILSILVNDYHYIILDLPSQLDRSIFGVLNQSDLIHILSGAEPVDLKRTRNLIERLKSKFNFRESKIKVIINEYKLFRLDHDEQLAALDHGIFATLPKIELADSDRLALDNPDSEYSKAVRRIARQLGDCLVGIVFGVGFAYGLCHIGVLKVIEEEKIPVDIICGSSIGALIAALWVTGHDSSQIIDIFKEFRQQKSLWDLVDLTIPTLGFIKGKKLHNLLKKYLGSKTFYDVKLPIKVIASDIKRRELKVLDKGLLVDAIMASCAMPGVFKPFRLKEEILFDGGVVSPLPTETLFEMGVKKIIAVNVTPSRKDILNQYSRIKEEIAAVPAAVKHKKWFGLKNYLKNKFKANILDFIFSSIEMLQSEVAEKESKFADIVLHPDLHGLNWLELHRVEEFARRGEEEARRNLGKIWQIVNE